jgi:drug/metabolite transporter (DMT)-like permease
MKGSSARKAYLFAILAVLFWSTSPTAFKLGLRYLDTWQLLFGASLCSTLVLGILSLVRGNFRHLKNFGPKDFLFSALMGLLNPVAYYLILFKAYTILPAQVAQPLNMVWPIVLVLLSIPLLGQRIGWLSIIAMFISFSGVVLISFQGGAGAANPQNRLGIILALSSSVVWAVYFLLNSKDRKDPLARMFLNFAFASGILLVVGLLKGEALPDSPEGWYASLYVGVFEMGVTFVLWLIALRLAPSSDRISNLVYAAPFLNLLLASQILDERIYLSTLFGIILLVAGILIQNTLGKDARQS